MAQVPAIIPIVVIGLLVGSFLKSGKPKIAWKKVVAWAIVAGILNAVLAYAEVIFIPQTPATFRAASSTTQTADIVFAFASFIAGFLFVAVAFGVASIYLRLRGGEVEPEPETEEESKLDTS